MPLPRSPLGRLATLAVVIGVVLGGFLWLHGDAARAELRFVAGERAAAVRGLTVELRRPGESEVLGSFRAETVRARPGGELGRWPLGGVAGVYELAIELDTAAGPRALVRRFELVDGAIVTIDLAAELWP